MAATYSGTDAFNYAKSMIKNMPLDVVKYQVLSDASCYLWMAAPWRWTLGNFPNITLTASTHDYTVTIPSDFLYLQSAYISDSAGNPVRPLKVEPFLVSGGKAGPATKIAKISGNNGASGTVRISPTPGSAIPSSATVFSVYKKQAPLITSGNVGSAGVLVLDDEWFHVYESGVLYYAYLYADDQRAGGAQVDPMSGKVQFSGQRGVFEANIEVMKQREKLLSNDPTAIDPPQN